MLFRKRKRKRNNHINNRVRLKRSLRGTCEPGNRASEKVTHPSMCFFESTDSRVKESCRTEGGCRPQRILAWQALISGELKCKWWGYEGKIQARRVYETVGQLSGSAPHKGWGHPGPLVRMTEAEPQLLSSCLARDVDVMIVVRILTCTLVAADQSDCP